MANDYSCLMGRDQSLKQYHVCLLPSLKHPEEPDPHPLVGGMLFLVLITLIANKRKRHA